MSQENIDLPPPPPLEEKRNMKVIALAIICILLAASLVGVIAVYAPLKAQMTQKDVTISSLQQNISELQASAPNVTLYIMQITSLEQQLSQLNDTISNLNDIILTLNDTATSYHNIAAMKGSMVLLSQQQATVSNNNSTVAYNDAINYAGYIKVQITSTSATTYVETVYSSFGVNFDQNITIGASGTATFPVLPGTIGVKIGNPDTTAISVTVTITYYY